MADTIHMGNDAFILYIRIRHPACTIANSVLGRRIWAWIQDQGGSPRELGERPCLWGPEGVFVGETKLPKTATHFEFARSLLPALYDHLDELGTS